MNEIDTFNEVNEVVLEFKGLLYRVRDKYRYFGGSTYDKFIHEEMNKAYYKLYQKEFGALEHAAIPIKNAMETVDEDNLWKVTAVTVVLRKYRTCIHVVRVNIDVERSEVGSIAIE